MSLFSRAAKRCLSTLFLLLVAATGAHAQSPRPLSSFTIDDLGATEAFVCAIAFDSAGRMYLAEQSGLIQQLLPDGKGGYGPPATFADLQPLIDGSIEDGLLGMTLAPDFDSTRELYLVHTTAASPQSTNLTRIRADATFTAMEPGSLATVLALPNTSSLHVGGEVHFPPGETGVVMFATGDGAGGGAAGARNLDRYSGKMLRVDRITGLGLPDNPFFNGDAASVRSRVWAYGFRNPFQWQFYTVNGDPLVVYNSENGNSTDRFSRFVRGSDGAWAGDDAAFIAPPDPNHRVLATSTPSVTGIAISPSGPFGTNVAYIGKWGGGIRRLQLTGAALDSATLLDGGTFIPNLTVVDLAFGPDGSLYFAGTGNGRRINRLRFIPVPPVASIGTAPASATGNAPFTVQFSDDSTSELALVSRRWQFRDGSESTDAAPSHTYPRGDYDVALTVTNAAGLSATAHRRVRSVGPVSLHLSGHLLDARTTTIFPMVANTDLRFYERDGTTPVRIAGGTGPGQNVLFPVPSNYSVDVTAYLSASELAIGAGAAGADGVAEGVKGFRFATGATSASLTADYCLSDEQFVVHALDRDGNPAATDIGLRLVSNGAPVRVGCGRDYLPGGPAPTGVAHRVRTDELGFATFPLLSANDTFRFSAPGDTGAATYVPLQADRFLGNIASARVELAFTRFAGGHYCDDLSAQPARLVDFEAQVQPLFDRACTSCHSGASPAASLDLTSPESRNYLLGPSTQLPGVPRMVAGRPDASFLMEKVGCDAPQAGARMPIGAGQLTLDEQALLRDWIRNPNGGLFLDGFE